MPTLVRGNWSGVPGPLALSSPPVPGAPESLALSLSQKHSPWVGGMLLPLSLSLSPGAGNVPGEIRRKERRGKASARSRDGGEGATASP